MAAADVLLVMITISMMAATAAAAAAAKGKGFLDPASTHYLVLGKKAATGQERLFCLARGRCRYKIIQCPRQCPHRKPPANNAKRKACFADCSSRCETTCKNRLPNCNGYGSVCYDPRFIGGDGVMFYFHGAKGGDFALVSDDRFQINVHFIGTRPAKKVAVWDDSIDALAVSWDGQNIAIDSPSTDGEAEWQAEVTKEIIEDKSQKTKIAVVVIERDRNDKQHKSGGQRNARDGRKSGADHGGGRPEARVPHTDRRRIRAPRYAVQIRRPDGQSGGNCGPDVPAGLHEHREEGRGDADHGGRGLVPHAVVPRDGLRRLPLPPPRRRGRSRIVTILNLLTLVCAGLLRYLL